MSNNDERTFERTDPETHATELAALLSAKQDSEERRRRHRMNSIPPRSDAEKRTRTKARAVRKRQKVSRRRNRR